MTDESREALAASDKDRKDAEEAEQEAAELARTLLIRRHDNHFGPKIREALLG